MATSFLGFRSLIENSPDAISLIDPHGEVLYASASTTKVFGYEPEELVGRNGWDRIHPEDRVQSKRVLQEVLAKPPGPVRWHARVRRKDGSYSWVESTVSNLLVEPDVQAIVVTQRDINLRRGAGAERLQQAEKLARARLELEEFAYTVAHDLREPLRTVSAFTQLLARRTQLDRESKEMADLIVKEAARMSTLLDDLLSFASAGANEPPQRVELRNAVSEATQNLRQAIDASRATVTTGCLPAVEGHDGHLVRVFQNLIGNAIQYRGEDPVMIHVTAELLGHEWVVKVKDNGVGIAPEYHARVFGLFKRLHGRDIPGTGIGLSICKKIVEGLGGTIWVESEPGAGSTFCFTITGADE